MTALSQSPATADRGHLEIHDPAGGELVGSVAVSTPAEVRDAVTDARVAHATWARTAPAERGEAVRQAAQALRARADDLAALNESETGKPREEAREGVLAGVGSLEQYAQLGPLHRGKTLQGNFAATDFMVSEPYGVVAALTPWNDPVAVSCGLLGAALVTGNTVVHKPSERCPHTGIELTRVLADALPDGVLRGLVGDGETGAQLTQDPRVSIITHVGSSAAGQAIAEVAARTGAKTLLENGGNDPLVVDRDVHPGWAAQQAALGAFANSGQICVAVERIFVHEAVAERFLKALVEEARRRTLAPLVDREHRAQVHEHVRDALEQGAQLLTGGELGDGGGAHYPATVLTECTPRMRVMREETFGPVAPVRVVRDFDQALVEAADTGYGLAATVLTASMDHAQRAWRFLPAGTVKVNAVFGGAPGGAAEPRGLSGHGFGYGPELLDEMTRAKVVHLEAPLQ